MNNFCHERQHFLVLNYSYDDIPRQERHDSCCGLSLQIISIQHEILFLIIEHFCVYLKSLTKMNDWKTSPTTATFQIPYCVEHLPG